MVKGLYKKLFGYVAMVAVLMAFSGCTTELFGQLSEQEANEMLAILLEHGIEAKKAPGKKGSLKLFVAKNDIALAVSLLKENGYPQEQFTNLGDVFPKDGLISSPLEEKARYIYALSQQIAETLTQLDGVLTARVHVVLPEFDNAGKETTTSSVSVFLKHTEEVDMRPFVPQIKLLVNKSIEGLSYDNISVALFPSRKSHGERGDRGSITSLDLNSQEMDQSINIWLYVAIFLLVLSICGNGFFIWRYKFRKP